MTRTREPAPQVSVRAPRGARREASAAHWAAPAPDCEDAEGEQNSTERRQDDPSPTTGLREWDVP